jgi:hypothetical protein
MAKPNRQDELRLLVNSRHPIITVETAEEERFKQMLLEVAEVRAALFELHLKKRGPDAVTFVICRNSAREAQASRERKLNK